MQPNLQTIFLNIIVLVSETISDKTTVPSDPVPNQKPLVRCLRLRPRQPEVWDLMVCSQTACRCFVLPCQVIISWKNLASPGRGTGEWDAPIILSPKWHQKLFSSKESLLNPDEGRHFAPMKSKPFFGHVHGTLHSLIAHWVNMLRCAWLLSSNLNW